MGTVSWNLQFILCPRLSFKWTKVSTLTSGKPFDLFDPPCSVNFSSHPGYVLGAGVCHRSCKQEAVWKLTKENIGLDWKHETNQADRNSSAYTSRIACPIQNSPRLTRAILWTKKVRAPLFKFSTAEATMSFVVAVMSFSDFGISFFRTRSFAFSTYRVRVVVYITLFLAYCVYSISLSPLSYFTIGNP